MVHIAPYFLFSENTLQYLKFMVILYWVVILKFCFGDIVVIESNLIGVVVKSWISDDAIVKHDVYVRYLNSIKTYSEEMMERYMVRHKYLSDEELVYQDNAVNNHSDIYVAGKPSNYRYKMFYDEVVPILNNSAYYNKSICTKAIKQLLSANKCTVAEIVNMTPQEFKKIWGMGKVTRRYIVNTFRDYVLSHNIIDEIITISDYDI